MLSSGSLHNFWHSLGLSPLGQSGLGAISFTTHQQFLNTIVRDIVATSLFRTVIDLIRLALCFRSMGN